MSNKEKEFIIIIDSSIGETIISEYDSNVYEDYEDFYEVLNKEHGLNLSDSNCNCMITTGEFKLRIL